MQRKLPLAAWLAATTLAAPAGVDAGSPLPRATPESQGVPSGAVREFVR